MTQSGTSLSFPDARILVFAAPKAACTSVKRTLAWSYAEPGETAREALHKIKRDEKNPDFLKTGDAAVVNSVSTKDILPSSLTVPMANLYCLAGSKKPSGMENFVAEAGRFARISIFRSSCSISMM